VWSILYDKRLSDSQFEETSLLSDTKSSLVLNAEDVAVIAKDDNPQQGTTRLPDASPDVELVDIFKFQTTAYDLSQAALVGVITGLSVAGFKLSVDLVRRLAYEEPMLLSHPEFRVFIPALGGVCVGALLLFGKFPPGLRKTIRLVDQAPESGTLETSSLITVNSMQKSAAAVFTLGTGNSLGPEGPCVELGLGVARSCMNLHSHYGEMTRKEWNRILLSCGAAAGVAAGFDAPVAGVFFALEVMQNTISANDEEESSDGSTSSIFSKTSSLTPVLLSSILSALVSRSLLGEQLILRLTQYSLASPLTELPMYMLLGLISGMVAFSFSQLSKLSSEFFSGKIGDERLRDGMQSMPKNIKPAMGGLFCGLLGLVFPQILFFGYDTLNSLLAKASLSPSLLLELLFAKMGATAVAAGSGLVGGTFAPSLFLGAVTGACFYDALSYLCHAAMQLDSPALMWGPMLQLADMQSYAMVGAASTLAALFRAPLYVTTRTERECSSAVSVFYILNTHITPFCTSSGRRLCCYLN
jgi:H+/Cl- antiporter ClcA